MIRSSNVFWDVKATSGGWMEFPISPCLYLPFPHSDYLDAAAPPNLPAVSISASFSLLCTPHTCCHHHLEWPYSTYWIALGAWSIIVLENSSCYPFPVDPLGPHGWISLLSASRLPLSQGWCSYRCAQLSLQPENNYYSLFIAPWWLNG